MYINFTSPSLEDSLEEQIAQNLHTDGGTNVDLRTHIVSSDPTPRWQPTASTESQLATLEVDTDVATIPPKTSHSKPSSGSTSRKGLKRISVAQKQEEILLGYITYDGTARSNASCDIFISPKHANHFHRDIYVGILDEEQNIEFLGRITAGPFYGRRSNQSEMESGRGDRSKYSSYGTIELMGQLSAGERLRPVTTRPRPFSKCYVFPNDRLNRFLGVEGDFYFGHLVGHEEVLINAKSDNKNFLPRNVGIFGTVGSGKSNTAQVIAEEAINAGWAVLIVDVEGEYVRMNEPTKDTQLIEVLKDTHDRSPRGVSNFRVYVPSSGESARSSATPFKVPISELFPEIVADILEFSEPERRVYSMITAQAARANDTGEVQDPLKPHRIFDLQDLVNGLIETPSMNGPPNVRLLPMAGQQDIETASLLRSKLLHLGRSQMLDWRETDHVAELPVDEVMVGGRLSVLDVSETDDRSRNIAITYVLQELFKQVTSVPLGGRMASGRNRPPLLVIIEEVHTFVSRAVAAKMRTVLDTLQTISRRGRKRWMSLALVSQQPNHVPDEVFELTNTRIIHQIKSPANLEPLQRTTPGVDNTMWDTVATLGPGQGLITGAVFNKPLLINMRPTQSNRLHGM